MVHRKYSTAQQRALDPSSNTVMHNVSISKRGGDASRGGALDSVLLLLCLLNQSWIDALQAKF
jgi:hypothetical protein